MGFSFLDVDCPLNKDGIPCCPKDLSLPMKREGSKSHNHFKDSFCVAGRKT